LVDANVAELAKAETDAMGQPIGVSAGFLVPAVAGVYRYYAGWADKIEGQTFPSESALLQMTQYEPYGVCAGIAPWNATLM
jgi:aldehyde dehydrogenase (NAD+)